MNYRIDKQGLLDRLSAWDGFLKRKVRLIACGGTAMTLLDIKASTKDIDLIVPNAAEYSYLIKILQDIGYTLVSGCGWSRGDQFIFDIFVGNAIHTTTLLASPLDKGNNMTVKEFNHIYLGVLNYYDIIISKIFRSTTVDQADCLALLKARKSEIDLAVLERRFRETASYDVSEAVINKNFDNFLSLVKKEA